MYSRTLQGYCSLELEHLYEWVMIKFVTKIDDEH